MEILKLVEMEYPHLRTLTFINSRAYIYKRWTAISEAVKKAERGLTGFVKGFLIPVYRFILTLVGCVIFIFLFFPNLIRIF